MSISDYFVKAPTIRPMLNIGCLMDIPTGQYLIGKYGESILNGGLNHITGVGGRGNMYKSTLAHFMELIALNRYLSAEGVVYDTEVSLTVDRLHHLAKWMSNIGGLDLSELGRLILTDKTVEVGNKWFDKLRNYMSVRRKESKKYMLTTPFVDKNGVQMKSFNPLLVEVDSLSQMDIEAVEKMYDKNEVGDSGLNTEALKGAAAKSQMLGQLPGLTGASGTYLIMTAHMGDEHQLDPYAPPAKKLTFLKGKIKFKRVPENFTFLTNNCWYCSGAAMLINQSTKAPEFPRNKDDDLKGDTDLMVITIQNLRGKTGPTGLPFDLVVSQRDGVQVSLTEFYYIKSFDRYGLGGHDKSYYLELVPDINLSRTTVRKKINENAKLRRALEITSEMCQMKNLWHHLPEGLLVSPKELYEKISALGYDWDVLLDTRGYWMFDEDITSETKPFLSTMDLLNMVAGKYKPYWYQKELAVAKKAA